MIGLSILSILIGLFFVLIGFKFTFKTVTTIKALQNIKYKSSSTPSKQAVITTKIFGVILFLIGGYFIGAAISALVS
ncbi:MAG: hypothetical protein K9L64_03860 [Candidatus Izimaplasma sp.]|nr:hypothetical protein [Candidatus Izimaplasma bacterium]